MNESSDSTFSALAAHPSLNSAMITSACSTWFSLNEFELRLLFYRKYAEPFKKRDKLIIYYIGLWLHSG